MIRQQFIRYATIGVLLNAALYGSYLLLTHTVMGSRVAMSITYCVGVLIGFLLKSQNHLRLPRRSGWGAGAIHRQLRNWIRDRLCRPLAAR